MKSTCCFATVHVGGEGTIHFYVCDKCGKPCNVTYESFPRKHKEAK